MIRKMCCSWMSTWSASGSLTRPVSRCGSLTLYLQIPLIRASFPHQPKRALGHLYCGAALWGLGQGNTARENLAHSVVEWRRITLLRSIFYIYLQNSICELTICILNKLLKTFFIYIGALIFVGRILGPGGYPSRARRIGCW